MKKKKKKKQSSPAYEFGQALGALLLLGGIASALKESTQEKPSPVEKEDNDLRA